jgi:hypothetical protein
MTGRGSAGAGPGRDARDVPRDALRDSPLRRLLLLLNSFDLQHTELPASDGMTVHEAGVPVMLTQSRLLTTNELTVGGDR